MRLPFTNSLLYSFYLLTQVAAFPPHQTRDDVGIQSVNLVFKDQCKNHEPIEKAWDDAIRLLTTLPKVDFHDVVAIEFFGSPWRNTKYQSKIQAVFDSAKTFGQGWKITPTLSFEVRINVNCAPDNTKETDLRCSSIVGLKAYAWNSELVNGTGTIPYRSKSATMNMHVCNSFFLSTDLDARVAEVMKKGEEASHNLQYYTNRAYITLHELFHSNRVSYEANGNRQIVDMEMQLYKYTQIKGRNYTRRLVNTPVYGAANAKILARTQRKADNFALFVLAKYVQSKLGGMYPNLPMIGGEAIGEVHPKMGSVVITNGSDWGVLVPDYEDMLKNVDDNLTFTSGDDITGDTDGSIDEGVLPLLADLEWIGDDQPTEPPPSGPTQGLHCNGLGSKIYVSADTLADNIKTFCQTAVAQGVQDKASDSIGRNYQPGTLDDVDISVDWPPGVKIPFDEPECNKQLVATSDNCDGNDPANPMNWKGGGTVTTTTSTNPDIKVVYHVTPKHARQPLPNTPGGGCHVAYQFLYDEFWIWGNGWATKDFGRQKNGLFHHLELCNGLTGWNFRYELGNDGREWSANGHLVIGKADCVARAIASAGGPKTGMCLSPHLS
ncbi:hypothetical protein F4808DRAFT_473847 [Astrocystis sublimbata]|nr:hypothetical protein F4808DRAFT_473847 [Astrocystis sublimbata]